MQRHKRRVPARAVEVNVPRHERLAGARRPGNQHRRVRHTRVRNRDEHPLHRRCRPDQQRGRILRRRDGCRADGEQFLHRLLQFRQIQRLHEIRVRAKLFRRDGVVEIAVRRDDQHRQLRRIAAQFFQKLQPVHVR